MSRFFRSLGYALSILAACLMISGPAIGQTATQPSAFDHFKQTIPSLEDIRNSKRAEAVKRALNPLKDRIGKLDYFTTFAEKGRDPLADKVLKIFGRLNTTSSLLDTGIDLLYGRAQKVVGGASRLAGGYAGATAFGWWGAIAFKRATFFERLILGTIWAFMGGALGATIGGVVGDDLLPDRVGIEKDPLDVDTHDQSFFADEIARFNLPLASLPSDTPDELRQNAQDYLQLKNLWYTYNSRYPTERPDAAKMAKLEDLLSTRKQDLCWQLEVRKRTPASLIDMNRLADPRVSAYMMDLHGLKCKPARQIDCTLCSP